MYNVAPSAKAFNFFGTSLEQKTRNNVFTQIVQLPFIDVQLAILFVLFEALLSDQHFFSHFGTASWV